MTSHGRCHTYHMTVAVFVAMLLVRSAFGQAPPIVSTVFPAGGQAGTVVDVLLSGSNLQSLQTVHCGLPGLQCEKVESSRFRLTIPADAMPGLYDLWAIGDNGVSAPRMFAISHRAEQIEVESADSLATAMPVPLNVVINGKIDKVGDSDQFQFDAKRGQRVVLECWAERIDSRLRAVLEVFDSNGRRMAVNRGYHGIDPLIDFRIPHDGVWVVKVYDLVSAGGAEHYYRLEIDTGPRVAFSVPAVIERNKPARISLFGWNLKAQENELISSGATPVVEASPALDRIEVEIPASLANASWPLPVRLQPPQAVLEGSAFPFHLPGSHAPVIVGLTDVPVVLDRDDNHSRSSAQTISVPCEVSGRLVDGDECDWFAIQAKRGESFWIEALGQRIQSPVDLQISVVSATEPGPRFQSESTPSAVGPSIKTPSINGPSALLKDPQELAQFGDEVRNIGGVFPTSHLDPAGRWVCPADGCYFLVVRNLTGGLHADPRRSYRLSVRREEPDFQLVAVPQADGPEGLNVPRGGRAILDVLAFRRRGMNESIRVSAVNLPAGIQCPDVWLGPGVEKTSIVVSADQNAQEVFGDLNLEGVAGDGASTNPHPVRGGTIVRSGTPSGWGRIMSKLPLAITAEAPLSITATANEPLHHDLYGTLQVRHSPGSILDVAVHVERKNNEHHAAVRLIGVGIPDLISNQTAIIPAGQEKGYLSFYLPPTLPVGRYSLVVRAETTVLAPNEKTEKVVVHSNPVTFDVQPPAFLVQVDPFTVTQAKRGETIQVGYSAQRINGFIGKMHTELAMPGRVTVVEGLRGRGETFVGQTDKGSIQIVVNDDAPLGRQAFLRLFTVGVVEDEPTHYGSSFLSLEIVE